MTDTQTSAYEDYDLYVKRLARLAAKRPLTKDEFAKTPLYYSLCRPHFKAAGALAIATVGARFKARFR